MSGDGYDSIHDISRISEGVTGAGHIIFVIIKNCCLSTILPSGPQCAFFGKMFKEPGSGMAKCKVAAITEEPQRNRGKQGKKGKRTEKEGGVREEVDKLVNPRSQKNAERAAF